MGWKVSLIIIESSKELRNDESILNALGKGDYIFDSETTLEESIYPRDHSMSIGYYRGNIIVSDDYQITSKSLELEPSLRLINEEKNLCSIFPTAEIISVACHSVVSYHGYSIIQGGKKIRIKAMSSDGEIINLGKKIKEEEEIYKTGIEKDGQYFWDEEMTEDGLMEEFTFNVARRRLGVNLNHANGDQLLEDIPFKKYLPKKSKPTVEDIDVLKKKPKYWIGILIVAIFFIIRKLYTILS